MYGVTKRTIRNWRRRGIIGPVKGPGGRILYRLDDLLRLVGNGKPRRRKRRKIK